LSLAYGWSPQQIADLTLAQIEIYLNETNDPGERLSMPVEAARAYAADKRRRKQAWICRTLAEILS
jgi:hypothetical protein